MRITHPASPEMNALCNRLRAMEPELRTSGVWPGAQLEVLGQAGVFDWFIPRELGGQGWSESWIQQGYVELADACLSTAFVLTQRAAATRRLCLSDQSVVQQRWLPRDRRGEIYLTIGVSQITTSGLHHRRPPMRAEMTDGGWILDGVAPWVTGASQADLFVIGAVLGDGRSIQVLVPATAERLEVHPSFSLVALTESQTARVSLDQLFVPEDSVLSGPTEGETGVRVGGFHTSALALGLARRVIRFLGAESKERSWLMEPMVELETRLQDNLRRLFEMAESGVGDSQALRIESNVLVCQATQAALVAAKGAGFVRQNPVGHWCQEAMFFLVWSCPEHVQQGSITGLVG